MVFVLVSAPAGRRLRTMLGALLLAAASGASQAGVGLVWDLSQWSYTATPSQTLELHASIYNEVTATEHLLGSRFVGAFGEGIDSVYDFLAPEVPLADQFAAMDLAPGQGMDFLFGSLAPVGGRVEPGDYIGGGFALAFRDASGAEVTWSPDRSLLVTVAEDAPGQALPEPASLALAGTGLGTLALLRRRGRKAGAA